MQLVREVQKRSLPERVVFPLELCRHLGFGGSTGKTATRLALLLDEMLLVARLTGT